ncbi:MAG TPA: hypothetical protein VFV78_12475 [Vicinamibacterales bacterium]|nr:hypothetical protein [Vicinamibacterales bacterium]
MRTLGLGAAVVALSASMCTNGQGPGPGGNDDRPPIIVSDGSVHLRVVSKDRGAGTNFARGAWKQDVGSGYWYHDHKNDKAKHLIVSIIHGKEQPGTECNNPEFDYDVKTLRINYSITASDGTIKTDGFDVFKENPEDNNPGRLMTNATGTPDSYVPFWLNVGDATYHLMSVTVGAVTCELEPGLGQVQIYQRMK